MEDTVELRGLPAEASLPHRNVEEWYRKAREGKVAESHAKAALRELVEGASPSCCPLPAARCPLPS